MRRRTWWLVLSLAIACDRPPAPSEPAEPAAPRSPPLALHEWGLIGYDVRDEAAPASVVAGHGGVRDVVIGPLGVPPFAVTPAEPAATEKPVLYAHVRGEPVAFALEVRFSGGRILERLPAGALSDEGRTLRWEGLVAGGPSCASSRRVALGDPECDTDDGYCESVEDRIYDTSDAACIRVAGTETRNHLLYRGQVPRTALPLAISFSDEGGGVEIREHSGGEVRVPIGLLQVANVGRATLPGKLLRITRDSAGGVSLARVDPPAPGETIRLLAPSEPTTPEAARDALRELVAERGLLPSEVDAFDRAWSHLVAGMPAPAAIAELRAGPAPVGLHPSPDALYYVLSDEAAAAAIALRVEGASATIRRAMVVRVDLDRSSRFSFHRPLGMRFRPPPDPAARIETLSIAGDYPEGNVRAAVFRRTRAIEACLLSAPIEPPARVGVVLELMPDHGLVRAALAEGSAADPVRTCVLDRLRRAEFPPATSRTTISMTIRLSP